MFKILQPMIFYFNLVSYLTLREVIQFHFKLSKVYGQKYFMNYSKYGKEIRKDIKKIQLNSEQLKQNDPYQSMFQSRYGLNPHPYLSHITSMNEEPKVSHKQTRISSTHQSDPTEY